MAVLGAVAGLVAACDTDEDENEGTLCTTTAECEQKLGPGWMCAEFSGKLQCVNADGPDVIAETDNGSELEEGCPDTISEGAPCTTPGLGCEGHNVGYCDDPCDACPYFVCSGSTWTIEQVSYPDCFACGDLQCQTRSEYCEVFSGGAEPSQSYTCRAMPESCGGTLSCACLESGGAMCSENDGEFTVHFMAP